MKNPSGDSSNFADIAMLVGAIVYFVCPMDLIPDVIGPLGFTDDSAALTMAFRSAISIFENSDLAKANERAAKLLGKNFDPEKAAKITKMVIDAKKK